MSKNVIVYFIAFYLSASLSANAFAKNESISTLLIYYGSGPKITEQSVATLAQYDLLIVDRFRFRQVGDNTWGAIKAISPNTRIMLYQLGPQVSVKTDSLALRALNNLGRYNVGRGSSDGAISSHPDWFLKNSNGERVKNVISPTNFVLDFGNKQVIDYWAKHTLEDIAAQEWRADGVYIDGGTFCSIAFLENKQNYVPAKYSTCESWNAAITDFHAGVSAKLQQQNQQVMSNLGNSINPNAPAAWRNLGQRSSAPNIMVEEGAFAVSWGDGSDVRYWPVNQWKQQIDLPSGVDRQVAFISHTDLSLGQQGISHRGAKTSQSQILRFAVGSYLLARNASAPTTFFAFDDGRKREHAGYRTLRSTNVYDKFDIGSPVAKYEQRLPDKSLYFRKYTNGYIYVNPNAREIVSIKAESDAAFSSEYENAWQDGVDWYFDLQPHDAAFVRNKAGTGVKKPTANPPPAPPVLRTN